MVQFASSCLPKGVYVPSPSSAVVREAAVDDSVPSVMFQGWAVAFAFGVRAKFDLNIGFGKNTFKELSAFLVAAVEFGVSGLVGKLRSFFLFYMKHRLPKPALFLFFV